MENIEKKKRSNYNKYTPVEKKVFINPDLTDDDRAMAARLKMFRKRFIGKTLQEATDKTGLPTSTVNAIENGKIKANMDMLQKYKEMFGLNFEWVSTGEGEPSTEAKEPSTGRSLQSLIETVNMFQTTQQNMQRTLNTLIRENNELRKEIDGLKEDMRHLNSIK